MEMSSTHKTSLDEVMREEFSSLRMSNGDSYPDYYKKTHYLYLPFKAIALWLYTFQQSHNKLPCFLAAGSIDLRVLIAGLNISHWKNGGQVLIWVRTFGHSIPVFIRQENNRIHCLVLDATYPKYKPRKPTDICQNVMDNVFKALPKNSFIVRATTKIQFSYNTCSEFAFRACQYIADHHDTLFDYCKKYSEKSEAENCYLLGEYRLPPYLMQLSESLSTVRRYIREYPLEPAERAQLERAVQKNLDPPLPPISQFLPALMGGGMLIVLGVMGLLGQNQPVWLAILLACLGIFMSFIGASMWLHYQKVKTQQRSQAAMRSLLHHALSLDKKLREMTTKELDTIVNTLQGHKIKLSQQNAPNIFSIVCKYTDKEGEISLTVNDLYLHDNVFYYGNTHCDLHQVPKSVRKILPLNDLPTTHTASEDNATDAFHVTYTSSDKQALLSALDQLQSPDRHQALFRDGLRQSLSLKQFVKEAKKAVEELRMVESRSSVSH